MAEGLNLLHTLLYSNTEKTLYQESIKKAWGTVSSLLGVAYYEQMTVWTWSQESTVCKWLNDVMGLIF